MSPERVARIVAWWVRTYTAGLPSEVRTRRIEELDADVADHLAHERASGTSDPRIAAEIAVRMIRGVGSDLSWSSQFRGLGTSPIEGRSESLRSTRRAAVRIGVFITVVLAIPALGAALGDAVVWNVADYVVAAALLGAIGIAVELAVRRRGHVGIAGAMAGGGLVAVWVGAIDDAPGLVLLGALLNGTAFMVASRRPVAGTRSP